MRKRDGQRHQLRRFITGIAEHHALISRTVEVIGVLLPVFQLQGVIHAQRNIRGLSVNCGEHSAGVAVKPLAGIVVTDIADNAADNLGDIHVAARADLAHNEHLARCAGGLARHAALRILFHNCIEDCVRNLVADFIGMPLGYGFRGKEMSCHGFMLLFIILPSPPEARGHKKTLTAKTAGAANTLSSGSYRRI